MPLEEPLSTSVPPPKRTHKRTEQSKPFIKGITVRTCEQCATEFKPGFGGSIYCSKLCLRLAQRAKAKQRRKEDSEYKEQYLQRKREYRLRAYARDDERGEAYRTSAAERLKRYAKTRVDLADGTLNAKKLKTLRDTAVECAYCGVELTRLDKSLGFRKTDANIDHVTPLVLGGSHGISNIVVACAQCNWTKQTMTAGEWLATLDPERAEAILDLQQTTPSPEKAEPINPNWVKRERCKGCGRLIGKKQKDCVRCRKTS